MRRQVIMGADGTPTPAAVEQVEVTVREVNPHDGRPDGVTLDGLAVTVRAGADDVIVLPGAPATHRPRPVPRAAPVGTGSPTKECEA